MFCVQNISLVGNFEIALSIPDIEKYQAGNTKTQF